MKKDKNLYCLTSLNSIFSSIEDALEQVQKYSDLDELKKNTFIIEVKRIIKPSRAWSVQEVEVDVVTKKINKV